MASPSKKTENAVGRPTKFKIEYIEQAKKLGMHGFTDSQLANFFKVNPDTIAEWKKVYPEFSESLRQGKEDADNEVEKALYKRATGHLKKVQKLDKFGAVVDTLEEVSPDSLSCVYWLNNRRPDRWRQKNEVTGENGGAIQVEVTVTTSDSDKT